MEPGRRLRGDGWRSLRSLVLTGGAAQQLAGADSAGMGHRVGGRPAVVRENAQCIACVRRAPWLEPARRASLPRTSPWASHDQCRNEGWSMSGTQPRVAMITGGNSGIGFAVALKLAARGIGVMLASRNQQASAQAMARIRAVHPSAVVESIPLDLSSFASVRQCASAFQSKGYPLHILINNAGGSVPGRQASFTVDGFELTFGTNHLGHFLLTALLLEDLKRSAPARVITVSSQLHDPAYAGGPAPDFDYDNLKGEKYYQPQVFYRNSKLANLWFAYELQRRLAGTACHLQRRVPRLCAGGDRCSKEVSRGKAVLRSGHDTNAIRPFPGAGFRVLPVRSYRSGSGRGWRQVHRRWQGETIERRVLR